MQVSNRALQTLADALRHHRRSLGSRWRRLPAERQALLVLAHLNKGEIYTALADGFGVGTTTVFRYVREGVDVLAATAPTLNEALDAARGKGIRDPRRHAAADRPRRHGLGPRPRLLLRQAQAARGQRSGPGRPRITTATPPRPGLSSGRCACPRVEWLPNGRATSDRFPRSLMTRWHRHRSRIAVFAT